MLKKVVLLGLLISSGTGINTLAATPADTENINVSTQVPSMEVSLERGTKVPTATWNVKNKGRLKFSGQAAYENLYTNYLLTGDSWYSVSVKNLKASSDTALSVQAYKKKSGWVDDKKIGIVQTVRGQQTVNYTLNGLSSSDNIYLEFKAPAHFEGWIE